MFQVNLLAEDSLETPSLIFFKGKSKKLKCHLLQFLCGPLRVNLIELQIRGGTEDNSKIIFLISQQKHLMQSYLKTPH